MTTKRFCFILSGLSCLAVVATMMFALMPRIADPTVPDIPTEVAVYEWHHGAPIEFSNKALLVLKHDVLPSAFSQRGHAAYDVADARPEALKPEFAESYATNGLNFVETRMRC